MTPKGFQQAKALAQNLAYIPFNRIYSSPLRRAVETAQVVSQHTGVEIEITDALREFDTGVNEGRRDQESWQRWEKVMLDWKLRGMVDSRIEGGESLADLLARFEPFLEEVRNGLRVNGLNSLMIGHGGLYLGVLPRVLKNIQSTDIEDFDFPNTGYVLAVETPDGLCCQEWCGKKYRL